MLITLYAGKVYIEMFSPKSKNLSQTNLSQIYLLKWLFQMVLCFSYGTNYKISLQTHRRSLQKIEWLSLFLNAFVRSVYTAG